jgi:hypothetical protein
VSGPTAAKGTFPYAGHRTIAQVDGENAREVRSVSRHPMACSVCGSRKYCKHRWMERAA